MVEVPKHGALVISLDFELYWGVRDFLRKDRAYIENIRGERAAVKAILDLFREFKIAATWATVGFLFARSFEEFNSLRPTILPDYDDPTLSPYTDDPEAWGDDESILFASDLVDAIRNSPRQEIATHTFSHYYCLDSGQSPEAFDADLECAVETAESRAIELRSIVFPRNQHNPQYDAILLKRGINCYRGNQTSRIYQFDTATLNDPYYRLGRLADTFVNVTGHNTTKWESVWNGGLANVPASIFLRPVSDFGALSILQHRRVVKALEWAARKNQIFHLWWHPHNFGVNLKANIRFLRRILESYVEFHDLYSLQSLSMAEVAELAPRSRIRSGQ